MHTPRPWPLAFGSRTNSAILPWMWELGLCWHYPWASKIIHQNDQSRTLIITRYISDEVILQIQNLSFWLSIPQFQIQSVQISSRSRNLCNERPYWPLTIVFNINCKWYFLVGQYFSIFITCVTAQNYPSMSPDHYQYYQKNTNLEQAARKKLRFDFTQSITPQLCCDQGHVVAE